MDARMSPAALRAQREYLGLTGDAMAARLGVRPDTVRGWESGKDPIPYGVPDEVRAVAAETAGHVEDLVQIVGQHPGDGWESLVVERAAPTIRGYGMRWWRHVVVRAQDATGADLTGLLVWPAHLAPLGR